MPRSTLIEILRQAARTALALALLWLFLFAGGLLKKAFHLILPANVLGMLLLLAAISSGLVKTRHVEPAGKWLMMFMPLLFVPLYAGAGAYKEIWVRWGWLLVPALILTVIAMWAFVGHFSQWIFRFNNRRPPEGANP